VHLVNAPFEEPTLKRALFMVFLFVLFFLETIASLVGVIITNVSMFALGQASR